MTKQMTYVEAIEIAIATLDNEEAVGRLEALKTSLQKKASTKKAVDNSEWEVKVVEALEGAEAGLTPTELMSAIGAPNTQKVASVVKGMSNVEKVQKGKKVTYVLTDDDFEDAE